MVVPHGSESGYDPYQAFQHLNSRNVFGYLLDAVPPAGTPDAWVCEELYPTTLLSLYHLKYRYPLRTRRFPPTFWPFLVCKEHDALANRRLSSLVAS